MMKIRYIYSALMCACIAFTGCSDDVLEEKNTPWNEGDGIIFGARAGYENDADKSRTQYTGEHYTYQGKDFERIEWVPVGNGKIGDHISIYSPQANIANKGKDFFVDYVVTAHESAQNEQFENTLDFATLAPAGNATLQWGNKESHTFYACYPTQATTTHTDEAGNVRSAVELSQIKNKPEGLHFVGRIPANQFPKQISVTEGEGGVRNYVAEPFMENAHMIAVNSAFKSSGKPVDLTFKSISTVLEIQLAGNTNQSTILTGVLIGSANKRVAGKYECDIYNTIGDGYPYCTDVATSEAGNQVMIPLLKDDGHGNVRGIMLNPGETLKLTAFLLPTADLDDLVLTIITPSGRQSHDIVKGQGTAGKITFTAHKKHYLKNIKLPSSFHSKDWMSRINDNVYVHQLSIPGSGSSFSNTYKSTNADYEYYQTQTLPIAEQWNKGIRCFEIISDRGTWSFGNFFEPVSLTDQPVIGAKGTDLSLTVSQAVEQIYQLVKANPTEFAMIVMTYQPEKNRNGKKYMGTFDAFYQKSFLVGKDEAEDVAKYDPNEILGNVRGKVMFLLRPTSDGEDMLVGTDLTSYANKNYTIINGWGSLHDKWKQRGYPVIDTDLLDGVNGNSAYFDYEGSIEKGMIRGLIGGSGPFDLKNKVDTKIDYGYNTNNSNLSVWAQEWNRVIPETKVVTFNTTERVYWRESYSEKLADAKLTFDKACQNTSENILFFNCLTGYFVNFADEDTYRPARKLASGSAHGNVVTFADKINTEFFAYVWDKWNARETGPLGVVMMNRINSGDITTNPGNFYMPNVVISNNFSYPLKQRP